MVQWLRLRPSTAGGVGSIPGRGIKILHAARQGQKNKKKKKKKEEVVKMPSVGNRSSPERDGEIYGFSF